MTRTRYSMALLVWISLLCGGCSTESAIKNTLNSYDLLDARSTCCTNLKDLTFSPLVPAARAKYMHDRSFNVIKVDGSNAYARGFSLPANSAKDTVRIRSNMSGVKQSVAKPAILLLDKNFEVLATIDQPDYRLEFGLTENDGFAALVPLIGKSLHARYIVIYTSSALRGAATSKCSAGYAGQSCPWLAVDPEGTVSVELLE